MKKSIYSVIISILFYTTIIYTGEKIKLYALYTPSHKCLTDNFFLPSIQDDFEIKLTRYKQTCTSARFMREGWTETTIQKVIVIIQAIKDNWGKIFIFSDVDIQFFGPIEDTILLLMEDKDMVIQKNRPNGAVCSGFFACRGNEKTLQLWQDVKKEMEKDKECSDQISLNRCLRRAAHKDVQWDYLPDTFFGAGTLTGRHWKPGMELSLPHGILMHHANWTPGGVPWKIKQLEYVREAVDGKTSCRRKYN